jgi:hypothetical protein
LPGLSARAAHRRRTKGAEACAAADAAGAPGAWGAAAATAGPFCTASVEHFGVAALAQRHLVGLDGSERDPVHFLALLHAMHLAVGLLAQERDLQAAHADHPCSVNWPLAIVLPATGAAGAGRGVG